MSALKPYSGKAENDSREKLEADMNDMLHELVKSARQCCTVAFHWDRSSFIGLLDRQDAITERECIDRWDAKAAWKIAELRAKVDGLAEERDRLRRQVELNDSIIEGLRQSLDEIMAERNGLAAQVDDLTKERDRALADAKTQRNNFEIATKARENWKELAAKSKGEVDDLRDERDELLDRAERYAEEAATWEQGLADVERTHMRLPVDADGVPIRPGDEVRIDPQSPTFYEVEAVGDDVVVLDGMFMRPADECRHAKPDTLEGLLQKLADEVWEASTTCQTTWSDSGLDGIAERYAERIRKAVEQ